MTDTLPPVGGLKQQAKRLRAGLAQDGDFISHSESLELIAKQYGYRDWNTIHAAAGNTPPPDAMALGNRVSGRYLGQAFSGEIIAIRSLGSDYKRVTIHFGEPVDVVTFDSFSGFRQRVSARVNKYGVSAEKTSDGKPQMEIDLI